MIQLNVSEQDIIKDIVLTPLKIEASKLSAHIKTIKEQGENPPYNEVEQKEKLETLTRKLKTGDDERNV